MKVNTYLVSGLLSFAWAIAPALAQIDINAGDGSQVKIGPGGVFVKSGGNVVKVRPTSVNIDQAEDGGDRQVKVGPGGVSIKSGGNVVRSNSVSVKAVGSEVRAAKGNPKPRVKHSTVVVQTKTIAPASVKTMVRTEVNQTDQPASASVASGNATKARNYAITSNNSEMSFTCNGDSCTVGSSNNTVTLRGNCSKLSIVGNNNDVICDTVEAVSITGSNNTVTWRAGCRPPTLSVTGNNNETGEAETR